LTAGYSIHLTIIFGSGGLHLFAVQRVFTLFLP
jgi:hypothetical protein